MSNAAGRTYPHRTYAQEFKQQVISEAAESLTLKLRGVQEIRIAVVDGPKSFPEAINKVFPEMTI
ncbi:hypothetical protein WT56_29735 [Burkholderia pseudomultivorans]|uniref:Transposase n=1 Tax=Burkholderia pseudomultivorans TaxID=1207504 RepID=A0A132E900_9BURK|nr:hypothetical protein WT56_29735 [Burkholderia pseudomultivorans]